MGGSLWQVSILRNSLRNSVALSSCWQKWGSQVKVAVPGHLHQLDLHWKVLQGKPPISYAATDDPGNSQKWCRSLQQCISIHWKIWLDLPFAARVMQNKTRVFVHDPHLLPMSRLDMPSRVDSCLRILDPIFTCSLALFTTVVSRIL